MSSIHSPALPPQATDDLVGSEVLGLSAAGSLAFALERRRRADAEAAAEMRAVCHFADLHRVATADALSKGAVDPDVTEMILDDMAPPVAGHGVSGDDGTEGQLRLAGEGAFMVAEFAVAELAAGLAMSEPSARAYVGRSLELRDRLPRLWAQVMAGRLPAWKGRLIAKETIPLNAEAAAFVDAALAPFAHKVSPWRVTKAVEAAILRHDPEQAAARARAAAEKRGVWFEDHIDGHSQITAVTNTSDAVAFDAALNSVANALGELGDTDPRQVRRAKAVGILADPQHALDLTTEKDASADTATEDPDRAASEGKRSSRKPTVHIHLHTALHVAAVSGHSPDSDRTAPVEPVEPVVRVDGLGPRSVETIRQWLSDLAPGATIVVTPVVDLNEKISVDAYEAPDRLRANVQHRDTSCQFPWCGRSGRFDLDHIVEYVDPTDGGPPGQTNSDNLSRLCRFHHRLKTFTAWDYERRRDGSLTWTSPLNRRYRVDHTGTTRLP